MDARHPHPASSGRIVDAGALRALAHPLRFRMLELLLAEGPATASGLGRLVGESSGTTSWHLRLLAEHGLIKEAADVGTGRDRYWRAVKGGWTLEGDLLQRDDTRADAETVIDQLVRERVERLERWHAEAVAWPDAWVHASMETTARLRLTREEAAALGQELVAVLDRYRRRQEGRELAAVDGAERVVVQVDVFPTGDPPPDGGESASI